MPMAWEQRLLCVWTDRNDSLIDHVQLWIPIMKLISYDIKHAMKCFSHCCLFARGINWSPFDFHYERPVMWTFFLFFVTLMNCWTNKYVASDLKCPWWPCDTTAMHYWKTWITIMIQHNHTQHYHCHFIYIHINSINLILFFNQICCFFILASVLKCKAQNTPVWPPK